MTERQRMIVIWNEADTVAAALAVREMAENAGMNPGAASALATAVSELTTNVVKYAQRGRLTLRAVKRMGQPGLEAVVEDQDVAVLQHGRVVLGAKNAGGRPDGNLALEVENRDRVDFAHRDQDVVGTHIGYAAR